MRKQLLKTIDDVMNIDSQAVTLLADIGVYAFKDIFQKYPDRIYNFGACEQSITDIATGLSLNGLTPIMYTIAPFISEKIFEELKLAAYNQVKSNFISVGASYDYSYLGTTHYCPADIGILKQIPNMEIIVPGHFEEFDVLFKERYDSRNLTYYRLSEYSNSKSYNVNFGKANVIKEGEDATIIVVGNMLDKVLDATQNFDVTILYYTTLNPFDLSTLSSHWNKKISIVEPYYSGALLDDVINCSTFPAEYKCIGIDKEFIANCFDYQTQTEYLGLDVHTINRKLGDFIYG